MTAGRLATGALVVIALAVGAIVGLASPRQLSWGDTASPAPTVSDAPQADVRDEWLDSLSAAAVEGRLDVVNVAVLVTDGAPDGAVEQVESALAAAGAMEAARVTLSADWWDPDLTTFRSELADQLAPNVVGASGAAPTALLQHAIVQALVPGAQPDPADEAATPSPGVEDTETLTDLTGSEGQSRAAVLLDALTRSGILSLDGGVEVGADAPAGASVDAVIIVAGSGPVGGGLVVGQAADVWERYVSASLVVVAADEGAIDLPATAQELMDAVGEAPAGREPSVVVTSAPSIATAQIVLAVAEQLDAGHGVYGAFDGLDALP